MKLGFRTSMMVPAALLWAAVSMSAPLGAADAKALAAHWSSYGRRALAAGRTAAAETAFNKALDLDPKSLAAWQGLADTFLKEGRADKVLETFDGMFHAVPRSRNAGTILVRGWDRPSGRVAGYYLYVSQSKEGGYRKACPLITTASSVRVDELIPGLRYYFVLTSVSKSMPPVESRPSTPWSMVCTTVAEPGR